MSDTLAIFLGKLLASTVVSAIVSAATVYFVVDMSLRGTESAIQTTNKRIDDLRGELTSIFELKFEALQLQIKDEFSQTRKEIKKAELDTGVKIAGALPNWEPVDFGSFQLFLDPKAASLQSISKSDPVVAAWALTAGNSAEAMAIMSSSVLIAADKSAGQVQMKWVSKSADGDALLTEFLKHKDCATISQRAMSENG